jgi:hypothetical protein
MKEFEQFIGKKVCVTRKSDGVEICGILTFVGYNEHFPSWDLHCTVDRMPGIQIDSIESIKLKIDRRIF